MKVAPKKTAKGTRKCPHRNPAKSNKGFGTYIYTVNGGLILY
jgi:hypothetical protein